jgi:hypothetical protein
MTNHEHEALGAERNLPAHCPSGSRPLRGDDGRADGLAISDALYETGEPAWIQGREKRPKPHVIENHPRPPRLLGSGNLLLPSRFLWVDGFPRL